MVQERQGRAVSENLNPEKLMAAYWSFGELTLSAISGPKRLSATGHLTGSSTSKPALRVITPPA